MLGSRYSAAGILPLEAFLRDDDHRASASADLHLLARLQAAGLPVAHGWVVLASTGEAVEAASRAERLRLLGEHVFQEHHQVAVCLLGCQVALRGDGVQSVSVVQGDAATLARWDTAHHDPEAAVLLAPMGSAARGRALSTNAAEGRADEVCVWADGASRPWRIDRRSTRVSDEGDGLDVLVAESAADLADRVQLALGRPVEVEWITQGGRPVLVACHPLSLNDVAGPGGEGTWRRISLALDDEGTVVPLAIDILDRALRREDDPRQQQVVERVFARPYRRRRDVIVRGSLMGVGRAGAEVAKLGAALAPFWAEMRRFEQGFAQECAATSTDCDHLDNERIGEMLTRWQELAAVPLQALDRARRHNRSTLAALRTVVGEIPRDVAVALSMPKFTAARREVHAQLRALETLLGGKAPSELDGTKRQEWKRARRALAHVRPLGIDLTPTAFGASNASLARAIARRFDERADSREATRRAAEEEVRRRARTHSLGPARLAMAQSLVWTLQQLTRAKGVLAEALAEALLGLRRVALEAGQRLEEDAILDEPEDALYLGAKEIRKSLEGNVAGYAARVRVRREDDLRWAHFDAPRGLGG